MFGKKKLSVPLLCDFFLCPSYQFEFLPTCTIWADNFASRPSSPLQEAKNSHGSHTETMGAAGHCLYRRLWPSGAGSNLWCALIGSWVMPPSNGSIKIERGGENGYADLLIDVSNVYG